MTRGWAWVIGGGILQLPAIRQLQDRGYRVLVTDRNPEAVGVKVSDLFVELDTYDISGHLDLAKELDIELVAVLTDAADVGPTVSALAERYGLPACSYEAAVQARNKARVRELLDQEHPVYVIGHSDQHATEIWLAWMRQAQKHDIASFPCVIKAADNCASRGLTRVSSLEEFEQAIPYARSANHDSTDIVVEECLSGWEVAVDFLVVADEVVFVNGAKRVFGDFGIEVGYTNPWYAPPEVCHLAEKAVDRLGVTGGPFKMDLLHDKRYGWCVLECATRWSGAFDHTHAARHATGRNLVKVVLDYALGLPIDRNDLRVKQNRYCAGYTPLFESGKIDGWYIPPSDGHVQGVYVRDDKEIKALKSCADRPVFVLAIGSTAAEAWDYAVRAGKLVQPKRVI